MQIEVRLFGGLVEAAGRGRVEVEVELPATPRQLTRAIAKQYPALAILVDRVRVAVDLEVADADTAIWASSEVALLPPVAGGSGLPPVEDVDGVSILTGLLAPPLPVREALAAVTTADVGATVSFLGSVRDHAADLDGVVELDYSAYEPMAQRELAQIARELCVAHPQVRGIVLLHALGELAVGDDTILVACTAAHRKPAF
ncbi:MAG: molybdenum cofactor biosynthesis protein MoaE, partial [Nitriliruptoraceae bacterium]